ncbi:MAG: hypothetical protein HYS08_02270 [Chlamydiae bacterium]|nr:hypothetical protein [Chlamydiota bacterium]MBI3266701.1 hypothetical protein [Chlamydiota bacterium]
MKKQKSEDRKQNSEDRSQKSEVRIKENLIHSGFWILTSVFYLLTSIFVIPVQALKISDFYQEAKVGQWILMKSSDGLLTRTAVVAKGDGRLTLRIQNFKQDQLISDAQETFDVEKGKIISVMIQEGNRVKEILPKQTEMDDFFQVNFRLLGDESVQVEKGDFPCKRYKGIFRDRVVKAWINDEIPILHLVKMTMQAVEVELVDYGG